MSTINWSPEIDTAIASPYREDVLSIKEDQQRIKEAIKKAQDYLLSLQSPEGYWVGELEADASVSAGYIPLMYSMTGRVDPERQRKTITFVKSKQAPDGSWSTYYGGAGDLNVSIQVYFALKVAGISASEPFMQRARDFILGKGGISQANVFTKIWLALFGQYDWRGTPTVPPEIMLLPNWFYLNIYEFASWSRATIVALTVVLTQKPTCRIPESAYVSELYLEPEDQRAYGLGKIDKLLTWKSFFLLMDALFKAWERLPFKPGRRLALRKAEKWIVEHQEADGSWGGIMLPWIYSLFALKSLGYSLDHPVIARGLKGLEGFIVEDASTLRLQPAVSPVWDTAWAIIALRESGLPADHPALIKAAQWLLEQEIGAGGDWKVKNPDTEPGCWAFEFENDLYPDLDDTPVVCRALRKVQLPKEGEEAKAAAIARAVRWTLSMQCSDEGWAAFDLNNDKQILAHVPFADFMTPLDPTCADVTAHVVELLGELHPDDAALSKALSYLKKIQEADGAWYGRWGVNYLYGTGLVLAGLRVAGEDIAQSYIQRATFWLMSQQNPDGGWGETCQSYEDPAHRGIGPSTASQTAWALMGLIATGETSSPAAQAGIHYLLQTQQEEGSWKEEAYTGTGFPRAFYLRYDLYRIYFPLMALARYRTYSEEAAS
jgi:squalene-hopene/tetraprenyl-beta-curcumene cyclase